jgi:putative ABC transport system substrate-binding protein
VTRRRLLGAAAAALALPWARAQSPAPRRIGVLHPGSPPAAPGGALDRFRQGLREQGLVEGRDVVLELRFDGMQSARISEQAADLVAAGVDLIVAGTTGAALAAQRTTRRVPVVMAVSGDPVTDGLVQSLARPGGNVTGMSIMSPALAQRRLQLMTELLPGLQRLALLLDLHSSRWEAELPEQEATARQLGLDLLPLKVHTAADLPGAFAAAAQARVQAVVLLQSVLFALERAEIARLALAQRLPAASGSGDAQFARAGGLLNYGANIGASWHASAAFVRRILDGAAPAELPIQQPTRFEFAINLRTADALGVAVPQALLLLADTVVR